jgi:hypothetical protein
MLRPATIVTAISVLFLAVMGVAVPVRLKSLRQWMGRLERAFPRRSRFPFLGLLFFSPFVVAIPYIRQLDLPVTVAVSAVGCACFVLSLHDIVFSGVRGIYERGLVLNAGCFPFSAVAAWDRPDPYTIRLRSRSGLRGSFSSEDVALVTLVADRLEKPENPLP